MKRILVSLIPIPTVCLLFWLGGFNFDNRCPLVSFIGIICIITVVGVYFYPGWTEE